MKENLGDINGQRLFPDRHAHTVKFRLNQEEFDLYKAVTAYINEFLPQASGRKKQSVALARTVLQRRLASLTQAIAESLRRRFEKQGKLLEELESLSPAQRAKRLVQIQGRIADAEQDEEPVRGKNGLWNARDWRFSDRSAIRPLSGPNPRGSRREPTGVLCTQY